MTPRAATKALAVDKRDATRKARHTLGKNQKRAIKGTVPPTAPTPSPVPAPSPAAAASSASAPAPSASPLTTAPAKAVATVST